MTPFIALLQNRAENFPDFRRSGRSELRVPFPAGRKPASWGGENGRNVTRGGAFGRRSRAKAQAIRLWMHDAFPRAEHGLSLRQ